MKVKDLERIANVAWSPEKQHPVYLAAGTAAQQLDASFSTNAVLEIYSLNLNEPGLEMGLKATVPSEHRFHKVTWAPFNKGQDHPNGLIVGGCDGGLVQIYSASKLLKGEDSLIARQDKHTGSVRALDFNPFQSNLLATGASESEIYIWDLNNTGTPMTPGGKSQPFEDVQSVMWNQQVQHILATTFFSRTVVWDLRKNEPIIKLSDTTTRVRWKVVAWHPEVATQLCLASEEDQAPVVQLWDLRFATSPLKILENHQRGVLSVAWCRQDCDLLVSCGKDNRILCWNPNSNEQGGEILSEIAHTNQWNFDVSWCPRNPALIAVSSFDGHISVYSVMGGSLQQVQTTNKIADSFPGMEGYVQAPVPHQQTAPVSVDLKKPPKWLKRIVGAKFGFGGKLITFTNEKDATEQHNLQAGQPLPPAVHSVYISQVVTEPQLVEKSDELEQALQTGNFVEYCHRKADSISSQHERYVWYFLKANFMPDVRTELLNLLGFKPEDVNEKLKPHLSKRSNANEVSVNQNKYDSDDNAFNAIAEDFKNSLELKSLENYQIKTGDDIDGLISQAVLLGNIEAAVDLCVEADRMADALIIAMTGGSELLARTQFRHLQKSKGYVSALISALVTENWSSVINHCSIESWKEAFAAALSHTSNEELPVLCERLGERLELEGGGKFSKDAQLCYICAGSFNKLVTSWTCGASVKDPEKLQELVELVILLQKAVEQQGRSVEITGSLADLLSHYAILLASQGNLSAALNYLGSSDNAQISELRERLYCNLGHKNAYKPQPRVSNARQSVSNYPGSARHSVSSVTAPAQQSPFNYNQFNTNLPAAPVQQSWQQNQPQFNQQPARPLVPSTPSLPPAQPPRPTSVGSAHGGSGITSRSRYVVDPSVQSNTYGMPTPYSNPLAPSSLPNPMLTPSLVPSQPVPNPVPTFPSTFKTNAINSSYSTPNPVLPPAPIQSNPIQNPVPFIPSMPQPTLNPSYQNPVPGAYHNAPPVDANPEVAQQALPPSDWASGWNDPPSFSKASKPQQKHEYTAQAPITHPLYGVAPEQPVNNGYGDVPPPLYGQVPPPVQPNRFPQQPPIQNYQQPVVNQPAPKVRESPKPIVKEPLPEEHIYLQVVFDELRNQCSCKANNAQMKRKLEDVVRKLDTLYDLIRQEKLSPATLQALHQMVQMAQVGNYGGALELHTQLVSGPDFSQIASFMPGLKVLLQCSLQLQVYLP